MSVSRRSVVKALSAIGAGASVNWTVDLAEGLSDDIPDGLTILFQGDSITDAGRNRGAYYANNGAGMGQGYVRHAATELLGRYPDKSFKIYNRGISGHKVFQLRDRWEEDCLYLKPDVLSILIGVNDFWHTLDFNYMGTAQMYEDDFMALMDRTKKELPDVKLIIAEPFVLHDGSAIKPDKWKGAFEAYQQASRKVADRFEAVFIPLQKIFTDALEHGPTSYWCPDGVHPSMAGNYLMSVAWMKAFDQVME